MGLQDDLNAYLKPQEAAAPAPTPTPAPSVTPASGGEAGGSPLKSSLEQYLSGKYVPPAPAAPAPAAPPPTATAEVKPPVQPPQPAVTQPGTPSPAPGAPAVQPSPAGVKPPAPGNLPEALAPSPQPVTAPAPGGEEKPLYVKAWDELNRFAASANKAPVDVFHGLAKGFDDLIARGGLLAKGDWQSAIIGNKDIQDPAYLSKVTGALKETYAPEKMIDEAHPVTRFLGELFGGLEAYMMPGGVSTKIATKALPEAPLIQKLLSNLITFSSTDAFQTAGSGGTPEQVRNAFLKALPTSVLFTVAQALPFDKMAKNPWMQKALESTATGTAFAGSHVMGGDTDPAGIATSFLTGFFLHALQGGIPRKAGLTPEERQKALSEYFDKYTVDWKETNRVNAERWAPVQKILDDIKQEAIRPVEPGKPILDQFGQPVGSDKAQAAMSDPETQAALAKPSWQRNAHEKLLADQVEKQAKESLQPPEQASAPGVADIIPGEPGYRERANVTEPSVERLQRAVDVVGDSAAGKKLGDLLEGNQDTLANAFRTPGETRGLPEITDKIMELAQKVEDTGDPGAAKELNDFINSNLGALKGLPRWPAVGGAATPASPVMTSAAHETMNQPGTPAPKATEPPTPDSSSLPGAAAKGPDIFVTSEKPVGETQTEKGKAGETQPDESKPPAAPAIAGGDMTEVLGAKPVELVKETPAPTITSDENVQPAAPGEVGVETQAGSTLPPGVEDFQAKYGHAGKVGAPDVGIAKDDYGGENDDRRQILKDFGKFNSRAAILRTFSPEERRLLFPYTKRGAQGPDQLLEEVKGIYPHLFGEFETDDDLLRAIINGKLKPKNYAKIKEAHNEAILRKAESDGLDAAGLAKIEADVEREIAAERDAIQNEPGLDEPIDTSWDFAKPDIAESAFGLSPREKRTSKIDSRLDALQIEYPDVDREKAATVLRAFPDAENNHIAAMSADPEMFSQVARGNLAAQEKAQLLKKASDAGAQGDLFGGGGRGGDTLFKAGEETAFTRGLTTEQIQGRLGKGGTVSELGPDTFPPDSPYARGWVVNEKSGHLVFINEAKDGSLKMNFGEDLGADYSALGITDLKGKIIAGSHTPFSLGSFVEVAKGQGIRTVDHELWHRIEHFFLNDKERAALARDFGDNEEVRAEAYAKWNPKEAPNTVFQKILDFFQRMAKALTGYQTGEDVFAKARSGELFGREAKERGLPEALAPTRMKAEDIAKPELSKAITQGKLTLEDYNARYADKYGEWDSAEWAKNFPDFAAMGVRMAREDGTVVTERKYRVNDENDPIRLDANGLIKTSLLKPWRNAGDVLKGVQKAIIPGAVSKEHQQAAYDLRSHLGIFKREGFQTVDEFKPIRRMFDKAGINNPALDLTQTPQWKMASDISMGRPVDAPYRATAEKIVAANADRMRRMQAADVPLDTFRENYFGMAYTPESRRAFNQAVSEAVEAGRGMEAVEGNVGGQTMNLNEWSDPDKTWVKSRTQELMAGGQGSDNSAAGYLVKRPMQGRESFTKQKVFDDVMTGMEFGLVPLSRNPVDIFLLKSLEMDRSIYFHGAIKDFKAKGDVALNPAGRRIPEGWVKLDGPYGEVRGPYNPEIGGYAVHGNWIAKAPVAELINNSMSQSLYNNPYFGKAFKGVMATGNLMNQFQLMSGFHIGFTGIETQISAGAEVLKDVYGVVRGNRSISDLGGTLKKYPTAMARFAMEGNRTLAAYANPSIDVATNVPVGGLSFENPAHQAAFVAKAAEMVGAGFTMDHQFRTHQFDKMIKDWYGGQKIKAALRSPIALSEMAMKPIMDYLVPRQKAGVFGDMVARIREQNPTKTMEQLRPELNEAWNRVDSRLGQVQYDRIFMRDGAKNAMQAIFRAPGWTGGTLGEIGGGQVDAVRYIKEWASTGKMPGNMPDRVAYTLSLLGTMALANGLMTYAFTGKKPEGMDYFAFRTGDVDSKGRDVRFLMPSYMKDLFAWYEAPGHTAVAKTHPLWSMIGELARNKDYYNTLIRDPQSSQGQQAVDMGKYVLQQYIPFGVRGMQQVSEYAKFGEQPGRFIAPQFGVMPAPRAYTNTTAQQVIEEYNTMMRAAYSTKEGAELKKLKSDLIKLAKNQDESGFEEAAQEAVSGGKLTRAQVKEIVDESQVPASQTRFYRLPVEWMARAMQAGSDYEKEQWTPLMLKKIANAKPEILIRDRETLVPLLEDMGFPELASKIKDLELPEEATQFDLTGMGITKPATEMGDMTEIDQAISDILAAHTEKLGAPKKPKSGLRLPSLARKESDKTKIGGLLGI